MNDEIKVTRFRYKMIGDKAVLQTNPVYPRCKLIAKSDHVVLRIEVDPNVLSSYTVIAGGRQHENDIWNGVREMSILGVSVSDGADLVRVKVTSNKEKYEIELSTSSLKRDFDECEWNVIPPVVYPRYRITRGVQDTIILRVETDNKELYRYNTVIGDMIWSGGQSGSLRFDCDGNHVDCKVIIEIQGELIDYKSEFVTKSKKLGPTQWTTILPVGLVFV